MVRQDLNTSRLVDDEDAKKNRARLVLVDPPARPFCARSARAATQHDRLITARGGRRVRVSPNDQHTRRRRGTLSLAPPLAADARALQMRHSSPPSLAHHPPT